MSGYETIKEIVEKVIGQIPDIITMDWLIDKCKKSETFSVWFFSFSDLSNSKFSEDIPYDIRRRIGFSTKTCGDLQSLFGKNHDMFMPIKEIQELHLDGLNGCGVEMAVIDYGFVERHDEI